MTCSLMMLSAWGIQQGLDTLGQDFLGKSVYLAVITSPMHCKKGIGCWNCWKHVSCWKYSTVVTVPHKKSLHPNQCKGNPLLIVWHEVPCWMSTKEIHHYVVQSGWLGHSTYQLQYIPVIVPEVGPPKNWHYKWLALQFLSISCGPSWARALYIRYFYGFRAPFLICLWVPSPPRLSKQNPPCRAAQGRSPMQARRRLEKQSPISSLPASLAG